MFAEIRYYSRDLQIIVMIIIKIAWHTELEKGTPL